MMKLASKSKDFISFRNSKLTCLLKPSLSGDANAAIICCVHPSITNKKETKKTLLFARNAQLIKTAPKRNTEPTGGEQKIEAMKLELEKKTKQTEGYNIYLASTSFNQTAKPPDSHPIAGDLAIFCKRPTSDEYASPCAKQEREYPRTEVKSKNDIGGGDSGNHDHTILDRRLPFSVDTTHDQASNGTIYICFVVVSICFISLISHSSRNHQFLGPALRIVGLQKISASRRPRRWMQ